MRRYNPANAGESAGGGVGGLEAEFLLAILLLVLLMFANNNASYSDRIMSFMKRGSLTCLLFFVLALIASTGQSASRIAKAIGALIIVAILITSPVNTVLSDVDNLIKNDWVGTTESAGDQTSASSGTQQSTNTSNLGSDFVKALENELNLQGQKATSGNPLSKSNIATDIKNALTGTLNGIIPGAGSILSKLGL
jgi:ABC-type transport system involved in multi-copper enzyme maturation permease subunit